MDKPQRLLQLMDTLRQYRLPVSAGTLANRLEVSVRTIYRDITTLIEMGADIQGEAGVGYVLRAGFFLPPLMFTDIELEALVLGAGWVEGQGDGELADAARQVLAKVASAGHTDLRERLHDIGLWAAPTVCDSGTAFIPALRLAIRSEHRLQIDYRREDGMKSTRTVWPITLAFFDDRRILVCWCELRQAFRHFRLDRIVSLTTDGSRYPQRRVQLCRAWHRETGHPEKSERP